MMQTIRKTVPQNVKQRGTLRATHFTRRCPPDYVAPAGPGQESVLGEAPVTLHQVKRPGTSGPELNSEKCCPST